MDDAPHPDDAPRPDAATAVGGTASAAVLRRVRRTVLAVAALNLGYFGVEASVALAIGSVSLLADSVDFLEDAAVNLLILLALGWSLAARSVVGKVLAIVTLAPAVAAAWEAFDKASEPVAPAPVPLVLAAAGAAVVNGLCAVLLLRIRRHAGSMTTAAWLTARNDVLVNLAIIAVGGLTAVTGSGWPDIVLGLGIIALAVAAAREVWEAAEEERLGAKALAGEAID